LKPKLIGSYKRHVAIRRVKDVDVFCRMTTVDQELTPSQILDLYFDVLNTAFGNDADGNNRVKRQARSIKVEFPEYGLHVDAVPARPTGSVWEIPTRDGGWQTTNPDQLTSLSSAMNDQFAGDYVPLVKLVRQTRRTVIDSRPGGLFVELCVYDACVNNKISKENLTLAYVTALEAIAEYLTTFVATGVQLSYPTLAGHLLTFRATEKQWETARDKFNAAATRARNAYQTEELGEAARAFQELLGDNGDGDPVFPMPPGYNVDGTPNEAAAPIRAGSSFVPAGDRRYA
jgi:hypothetical protein